MIRLVKSMMLLAAMCGCLTAHAQSLNNLSSSLTIYVYPPRQRINWSTPKSTINSMLKMQLDAEMMANDEVEFTSDFGEPGTISSSYRSTMGHTIGHISCVLPNGRRYEKWTSFTGQNYGKADKAIILEKKIGAGVLFHDFIDGEVIAGAENSKRVNFYQGGKENGTINRPRYLQMEVGALSCMNIKGMVDFFESFHHPKMSLPDLEKLPPEKRIFFSAHLDPYESYLARLADPRAKVGGGCAPYGAALMKIAGIYQPALERFFRRPLAVSERLIGGIVDPATGKLREVPLGELMFGKLGDHWTYAGYANRQVNLYDPQLIYDFIGQLMTCEDTGRCTPEVAQWMNAQTDISRGEPWLFRERYMAAVGARTGQNGRPTERIPQVREQVVNGVVWRH